MFVQRGEGQVPIQSEEASQINHASFQGISESGRSRDRGGNDRFDLGVSLVDITVMYPCDLPAMAHLAVKGHGLSRLSIKKRVTLSDSEVYRCVGTAGDAAHRRLWASKFRTRLHFFSFMNTAKNFMVSTSTSDFTGQYAR